jgi:hypothetical protein
MPLTYGNRIKVQFSGSVGPGTGDFILGTPVSGYQSFASAGIANTNQVRYVIEEGSSWEIGTGQYLTAGPKVVRTVIQSSAGVGVLVNFTPAATIMVSVAAGDFVANPDSVFSGSITEAVYAIPGGSPFTPSIDPVNGTIQTWTLGANSAPTISAAFTTGEAITLMIDDGTAYAITWPTVPTISWKTDGGFAPTLNATGATAVVLWNVGGTVYGARVGNA